MQWDDPLEKYLPAAKFKVRSNDPNHHMMFRVERVEVGVVLTPDTFTLEPSTGSGWGK